MIKITNSNIKGYHIFKVRPHSDIKMLVKHEDDNKMDENAMKIVMPVIEEIAHNLREAVTRKADKKRPEQKVCDIAGKMVGRVPANLGKVIREVERYSERILW